MTEPVLSVIVPVLNEAENIAEVLSALQQERGRCLEIILVDGGSTDDTPLVAQPCADKLVACPPGRARQMNVGAAEAQGQYLFFLHADTLVTSNALSKLLALCTSGRVAWGFFRVHLAGRDWRYRMIAGLMNFRSQITRVATGDQGIFISRDVFRRAGGFRSIPLMEDIEFSKRLRKIARPVVIGTPLVTSARRWERHGVYRTILLMWYLRLAYFLGVSPNTLHRHYYKPDEPRG